MKSATIVTGVVALATSVAGHATFQELWVNGKDMISTPLLPVSVVADIRSRWYLR